MELNLYKWNSKPKNYEDDLVYVADFETSTINCNWFRKNKAQDANFFDSRITYWYAKLLYYNNPKRCKNFVKEAEGTTPKSFMDFLCNLPKNATIYFHNLTFDGRFIIKSVLEKWAQLNPKKKPLNPVHLCGDIGTLNMVGIDEKGKVDKNYFNVFRNGKTIYKIEMKIKNNKILKDGNGETKQGGNDITITFRCSLKMLTSSVNSLGKGLSQLKEFAHLTKYKEGQDTSEFYDVEPIDDLDTFKKTYPDYVEYCKRDVEIVIQSIIMFNKTISELPTIKNYLQIRSKKENKKITYYNAFKQSLTLGGLGRHIMGGQYVKCFQYGISIKEKDGKIIRTFNQEQKDLCERLNEPNRPVGSMIIQDFNEHNFFKKDILYDPVVEDDLAGANRFYIGGFTQFNKDLQTWNEKELIDGIKLDVKSAYPYQMTKPLPYGPIMDEKHFKKHYLKQNKNWKEGVDYIKWNVKRCSTITPKEIAKYCPVLPNAYKGVKGHQEKDNRYTTQEQNEVVVCACEALWNEYQYWYDFEIDSEESYYQLAAPYLRDVALELYNVKEYKYGVKDEQGNKIYAAQQLGVKILLNSLYGSLAMRPDYPDLCLMNEQTYEQLVECEDKLTYTRGDQIKTFKVKGESETCEISNFKTLKFDVDIDVSKKKCFNASAPTLITQLERVYLFETIRNIGAQYFAYSDTDSIMFYNFPPEIREKIIELSKIEPLKEYGTNLGQWEIEDLYIKSFKSDKAKQYFYTTYKTNKKGEFIDKDGNVCDKANAATKTHRKSAGGIIGSADECMLIQKSKTENEYWTFEMYKEIYNEFGLEPTEEDFQHFMDGDLVLLEGNKIMVPTPSGWLLKTDKKIISKGRQ